MATRGTTVTKDADTLEERAARAAQRRNGRAANLQPIDEIRPFTLEGAPTKSAYAYYLRPDGATIADTLIYYPNGGVLPLEDDPKRKFATNADYYQGRQRRKGFEYVGPSLTPQGARRLVEILEANRPAEVERLEDELALCEQTIAHSDHPDVREHERGRKAQLLRRLARVQNQFDPDVLVKELNDIANAQEMANVPAAVMRVMRRMLASAGQEVKDELIARFARNVADDTTGLSSAEGAASIG